MKNKESLFKKTPAFTDPNNPILKNFKIAFSFQDFLEFEIRIFPGNLKFASNPVNASGENVVLSSMLNLISSSQSKSSGITVIKPC